MISSLHELDNLYIDSSHQLNRLVANLHPYVVAEVNRILADSLNVTRRAMLPAIGVSTIIIYYWILCQSLGLD